MDTLDYIVKKYELNLNRRLPVEIPDAGRDDLPGLFNELGFRTGAEIGVERGKYSEKLCQGIEGLHLYCIDAWKDYPEYREYDAFQQRLNGLLQITKERLAAYNTTIIKAFSMDAVKTFDDESLDFVYIDANHALLYVTQDILYWSKKVRPGGIVAGHDYVRRKKPEYGIHVVEAVGAYTVAYHINPWFVLGSRAIVPGETRDQPRSWMWVK